MCYAHDFLCSCDVNPSLCALYAYVTTYTLTQKQRDTDWLRSSAQAMELELDQDWYGTETAPNTTDAREANGVQSLKGTRHISGYNLSTVVMVFLS